MARGAIEHHNQPMIAIDLTEVPKELLQTHPIDARQLKAETFVRDGIERSVEVAPLVGAAEEVGRTKAFRALTSSVPGDQSKERASSKAKTFSGLFVLSEDSRSSLASLTMATFSANFFESLLFFGVSLLMPRATRLELHPAPPEKPTHPVGTGVLDTSLAQKISSLSVGSDPPLLHDLLELFPSLLGEKLLAASLIYPTHK